MPRRSLLRAGDYAPLRATLEACVSSLQACEQDELRADPQLLKLVCDVAAALARCLEAAATSPVALPYVPPLHGLGVDEPATQYEPASHALHAVSPVAFWNVPPAHLVHSARPFSSV